MSETAERMDLPASIHRAAGRAAHPPKVGLILPKAAGLLTDLRVTSQFTHNQPFKGDSVFICER
jgi:hypothetical protein